MSRPKNLLQHKNIVTLNPGEFYVSNIGEDIVLHTLLGSCVAACLYDPKAKIIGMNHFLLSNNRYAKDLPYTKTEAGKYGINSMELLINDMLKKGATRKYLRAKAFGGASVLQQTEDNFFCVGNVNAKFIENYLKTEHIPLESQDLRGTQGRIIYFSSCDYGIDVRKIRTTETMNIALKEKNHWKKKLNKQESRFKDNIELWD